MYEHSKHRYGCYYRIARVAVRAHHTAKGACSLISWARCYYPTHLAASEDEDDLSRAVLQQIYVLRTDGSCSSSSSTRYGCLDALQSTVLVPNIRHLIIHVPVIPP